MLKKHDFPLSDLDIKTMVKHLETKPARVIPVSQLLFCDTVEDIFKGTGSCFVWYPYDKRGDNAHWLVLIRNIDHKDKYVYFFDSCGYENILEKNDELRNHILNACIRSGYRFLYNDQVFQSPDSALCGRYCLIVYSWNKQNLSPLEIEKTLAKLPESELINIVS